MEKNEISKLKKNKIKIKENIFIFQNPLHHLSKKKNYINYFKYILRIIGTVNYIHTHEYRN